MLQTGYTAGNKITEKVDSQYMRRHVSNLVMGSRPCHTSLAPRGSLVGGGDLMRPSPSVGAMWRFVRLAYRTPFGVGEHIILSRATVTRTAQDLCQHSTNWWDDELQINACSVSCWLSLRPTRSLQSLLEAGASTSKYAEAVDSRCIPLRHDYYR